MSIVLFLASLGYFLMNRYLGFHSMGITGFINTMYYTEHCGHLWYLYAYIPYLMALPLLRPMVKSFKNEHFLYMILCYLFFYTLLPLTEIFVWQGKYTVNSSFNMNLLAPYILTYPFVGYYIENRMDVERAKKKLPLMWGVNIAGIVLYCVTQYYIDRHGIDSDRFYFSYSFKLVNMMTLYITAKCLLDKRNFKPFAARIVASLGKCTFGIYLIHVGLMGMLRRRQVFEFMRDVLCINDMLTALLCSLIVMITAYMIIWLVKKIPIVNKLI